MSWTPNQVSEHLAAQAELLALLSELLELVYLGFMAFFAVVGYVVLGHMLKGMRSESLTEL